MPWTALRQWKPFRLFENFNNRQRRRTAPARLSMEALEDRLTPAPLITGLQPQGTVRPFLGENASYSFNFENPTGSGQNGFSPYITVFLDTSGTDFPTPGGTPDGFGTPIVQASGLLAQPEGAPVVIGLGQTTYTNPFTGQTGLTIPAGFGQGDTIYVYRLPFGSFTPGQTTQVTVTLPTSNLADLNQPLELAVLGGYRDGENAGPAPDPLDTPVESAAVFTDATPRLYELRKIYLGPEDETATGPNYVRRYRLEVDIATGQTLTGLQLTDDLAPSMQIVGRNILTNPNQPFGTGGQANMAAFLASSGLTTNVFALGNLSGTAVDTAPDGTLIYNFGNVTGVAGVDAVFEFNFWVPRDFANPPGGEVLPQDATTGTDDIIQQNRASSVATWDPLDPRDPTISVPIGPTTLPTGSEGNPAPETHNLQEHSIATQKTVSGPLDLNGVPLASGSPIRPGQTLLRYTIDFQVSDYYAFQNITLDDLLGDGQRLYLGAAGNDPAFAPTLRVNNAYNPGVGRVQSAAAAFGGADTIDYRRLYSSDPDADPVGYGIDGPGGTVFNNLAPIDLGNAGNPYDGSTFLRFNISDELIARGNSGMMVGGEINNDGSGPDNDPLTGAHFDAATGQIVFYVIVTEEYSDSYTTANGGSDDPSVDQGDILENVVPIDSSAAALAANGNAPFQGIRGEQLRPDSINGATVVIGIGDDDTAAGTQIPFGDRNKVIYAINNVQVPDQTRPDFVFSVQAGDLITYRLTYTLPISRFEDLELIDRPPLPFMQVQPNGTGYTFTEVVGTPGTFAANQIVLAPGDTFFTTFDGTAGNPNFNLTPSIVGGPGTITTDTLGNAIIFNFGDFEDPQARFTTIDLFLTLQVGDEAFLTDFFLTNQLRVNENSTNGGDQSLEDLRRFQLVRPVVTIDKGVVGYEDVGSVLGTITFDAPGSATGAPSSGTFTGGPVFNNTQANAIGQSPQTDLLNNQVDADDRVRYAIVAQNIGRGDAFDVTITDAIPDAYDRPTSLAELLDPTLFNLRVLRGDGTALNGPNDAGADEYTITYDSGTGQFVVTLVDDYTAGNVNSAVPTDPNAISLDNRRGGLSRGEGARAVDDQDPSPLPPIPVTNGSNTVVILYDVILRNTAEARRTIVNTAAVTTYSSVDNGNDLTDPTFVPGATDPSDIATVITRNPSATKQVIATSVNEAGNNFLTQATIGEVVTYQVTVTVPDGTMPNARVVDALPVGMQFVEVVSVAFDPAQITFTNTIGLGTGPSANNGPTNVTLGNNGTNNTITFNFGTITNSPVVPGEDDATITITYRAVVLNVAQNQSGNTKTNSVVVSWEPTPGNTQSLSPVTDSITIVEPTILTEKFVTVNGDTNPPTNFPQGDSGDPVQYNIRLTNSGANVPIAYDATFRDPLPTVSPTPSNTLIRGATATDPPTFTVTIVGGVIVNNNAGDPLDASDFEIVGSAATGWTVQTRPTVTFDLANGQEVLITIDGFLTAASITNTQVDNTATTQFTSIDGVTPPASIHSTVSVERTGNTADPGGAANDYRSTDTATYQVLPFVPTKAIVTTSEAHTSEAGVGSAADPRLATIGEVVRYRLYVQIAEGTTPAVSFQDVLPTGLTFLGNARVAFVSTNGFTTTFGAGANLVGNDATVGGLASTTIVTAVPNAGAGQTVTFNLGDLVNNDVDVDAEYAVIEFNVLVGNIAGNDAGDDLVNNFNVLRNNVVSGPASNNAVVRIVEPNIVVDKTVDTANADARQGVTFTIVFRNGSTTDPTLNANVSTAFETLLIDAIPPGFENVQITGVTSTGTVVGVGAPSLSANLLMLSVAEMAAGSSITVTLTANVTDNVATDGNPAPLPGTVLTNNATATTTSLPGNNGTVTNPTGQPTPGGTGASNGERNGSGGVNRYSDTDPAAVTIYTNSISGNIYNDANNDGAFVSESLITGQSITITLSGIDHLGNIVSTSQVTTTGTYSFTGLRPGLYTVTQVTQPTGFLDGRDTPGTSSPGTAFGGTGTGATDSRVPRDADAINTINIGLVGNKSGVNYNFGEIRPATLGNFVWEDTNGNGQQNAGELGINGVQVILNGTDDTGRTVTLTTFTTNDVSSNPGFYQFPDLRPGSYTVRFVPPSGYQVTVQNVGADATDSDADPTAGGTFGQTVAYILDPGESEQTVDAGLYRPVVIGDRVWIDTNGNGVQDGAETAGLAGVVVTLTWFGPDGALGGGDDRTFTDNTDANGLYLFDATYNVPPGNFRINYALPGGSGYVFTGQDLGGNDATDSDPVPGTGTTASFTVNSGGTDLTRDAGVFQPAALGNFVWNDANANGQQDVGEAGINGVTVNLITAGLDGVFGTGDDVTAATTTTANVVNDGAYSFTNLTPGDYRVTFVAPGGFTFTSRDVGADATDSDANPTASPILGQTGTISLASGETNNTIDAGLFQAAALGDRVWLDADADGVQDAGEANVANVTVTLFDATTNTQVGASTTTNGTGNYSFTNLRPGSYYVVFSNLPAGALVTSQNASGNEATDSDVNTASRQSDAVTLVGGQTNNDVDMGIFLPAALGDRVWLDADADGIQDAGETAGVAGVTVTLFDAVTNAQVGAATATDVNGNYSFIGLRPGSYYVEFSGFPAGFQLTTQNAVGTEATDSDANTATGRSDAVTLVSGQTNNDVDAGLFQPAALGDRVWLDVNGNGVQDASETAGVGGVTVALFDATNTQVGTTTTDGAGNYSFTGLRPGSYSVQFSGFPAGFQLTTQNAVGTEATDSDANTATGRSDSVILVSGQTNNDVDAGLFQPATIGNFVWDDLNGNGQQDGGELGISGVTVNLQGAGLDGIFNNGDDVTATTTTNGAGAYSFTGLTPGDYQVTFVAGGRTITFRDVGNDGLDSDADRTTGTTGTYTLTSGEVEDTVDAGMFTPVSLGNFVWEDLDGDGLQDGGEPGIGGVTVNLRGAGLDGVFNSADDVLATTTTAAGTGIYGFTNLTPGQYQVTFVPPSGYRLTAQDQVGTDATDSDADPTPGATFGQTTTITLTSGEAPDLTWDAGMYRPATIGDFVWQDTNGNGVQDGGEAGVGNALITVTWAGPDGSLATTTDNQVFSTTSNASGFYQIPNLPPGNYEAQVTLPPGFSFIPANVGGNDAVDSDPDPLTGRFTFDLASNESDQTLDVGTYRPVTIGDRVWIDTNGNGVQDGAETAGVAGVTVTLTWGGPDGNLATAGDNRTFTDTTDANGNYLFDTTYNIPPGTFQVNYLLPGGSGLVFTGPDRGGNDALDSDPVPGTGTTGSFTVASGGVDLTLDAGVYLPAALGDRVWDDLNGNGQQDGGEPGINGVTVNLRGAGLDGLFMTGDDVLASDVTDANGDYSFTGLAPGDYQVTFVAGGRTITFQNVGNDASDSDADRTTGATGTYSLASGETNNTIDAGMYTPVALGDFVWEDLNGNGRQDALEPGISNVTVNLRGAGVDGLFNTADDVTAATTTDGSGNYGFTNLAPGQYQVTFVPPTGFQLTALDQGADAGDSDADPTPGATFGRTATITLVSGQAPDLTWDAGMYRPARIGDFVWQDTNGNGRQDSGEAGVGNALIVVTWAGPDGNLATTGDNQSYSTTSNATGFYEIPNLPPGNYEAQVTLPPGFSFIPANVGVNDAVDSDPDPVTGRFTFDLTSNETDLTLDVGTYRPVTIGDRVWIDTNGDGVQDATETTGVAGVTVTLTWAGPDGSLATAGDNRTYTDTTDADGNYLFDTTYDIPPGTFQVNFALPGGSGLVFTGSGRGGNGALDSDPAPGTGTTPSFPVNSGGTDLTLDAGVYLPATISDFVWDDLDGDGQQDAGEPGIANVTVNLRGAGLDGVFNTVDDVLATTTTDGNGLYEFDGLAPGDYQVTFVAPNGMVITTANRGADATDSDADPTTGQTGTVSLVSGQINNTIDAGMYTPVSLGDFVWEDLDGDGVQDGGEPGIDGVTVNLRGAGADGAFNTADDVIATTTTAGGGLYLFDDLAPGQYVVTFVPPTGYRLTLQNQGGDGLDSDANPTAGATFGQTAEITLVSGQADDLTWDAGMYRPASLGDFVWNDRDDDGTQDAGEPPLRDVRVFIDLDNSGTFTAGDPFDVTDVNGGYLITDLPPGTYTVIVDPSTLPPGLTNPTFDRDGTPDGVANTTTLTSGQVRTDVDFAFNGTGSIGDRIWNDQDGDGVQDGGEPGLTGVTVALRGAGQDGVFNNADDVLATTTTGADGLYTFDGLGAGVYQVTVVSGLPAGFTTTYDLDGIALTPDVATATLAIGQDRVDVDFGYNSGQTTLNGFIGDRIWYDADNDGVQDAGEPGIAGVTVRLQGAGQDGIFDTGDDLFVTQVTGPDGDYGFGNLFAGRYRVTVDPASLPIGVQQQTYDRDGTGSGSENTSAALLTTNDPDNPIRRIDEDFGYRGTGVIGDRVWLDADGDGIQDVDETTGVSGVTVTLTWGGFDGDITTTADNVTRSTTTDADGEYLFDGLPRGEYQLLFTRPSNELYFTSQDQGGNEATDSDVVRTGANEGRTGVITLDVGGSNLDVDAGLRPEADLVMGKVVTPTQVFVGFTVTYTFTINNLGGSTATGVVVTDPFPPELGPLTVLAATQGVATIDAAGVMTWNVGSLASGASAQLQVTARVNAAVTINNVASAEGNEFDPNLNNNTANIDVIGVFLPPGLVSKRFFLRNTPPLMQPAAPAPLMAPLRMAAPEPEPQARMAVVEPDPAAAPQAIVAPPAPAPAPAPEPAPQAVVAPPVAEPVVAPPPPSILVGRSLPAPVATGTVVRPPVSFSRSLRSFSALVASGGVSTVALVGSATTSEELNLGTDFRDLDATFALLEDDQLPTFMPVESVEETAWLPDAGEDAEVALLTTAYAESGEGQWQPMLLSLLSLAGVRGWKRSEKAAEKQEELTGAGRR